MSAKRLPMAVVVDRSIATHVNLESAASAVAVAATAALERLGYPTLSPDVTIDASDEVSEGCRVIIEGSPVPLTARRRERLAIAMSGCHRRPDECGSVNEIVASRLAAAEGDRLLLWLEWSVDAVLSASGLRLLRFADLDPVGVLGCPERACAVAHEAMELAVGYGIPPSMWARLDVADEMDDDAYVLLDQIVAGLDSTPAALRGSFATLRRLTTGPRPLAADLLRGGVAAKPSTRGIQDELWSDHGVVIREIALRFDSLPDDIVCWSFGPVRGLPALLWSDELVVVPTGEPDGVAGWVIDPLTGRQMPLVPADVGMPVPENTKPAAWYALRAMMADAMCRLALYASGDAHVWPLRGALATRAARVLPSLRRALLADRGTVQLNEPLLEGIVECLAAGREEVSAIVGRTRAVFGSGVLGPVPVAMPYMAIELTDSLCQEALSSDSIDVLVAQHPSLVCSLLTSVVVCPTPARSGIQRLLRPLIDSVLVVGQSELTEDGLVLLRTGSVGAGRL